jgi:putative heme-binding domain-containing protein
MDALAAVDQVRGVQVLEKTLDDLTEPSDVRQKAADTLGKINSDRSRSVLGRHLPPAPAGLATTIARRLAVSRDGADLLLKTVSQGKASAHLLQDAVVDLRLRENDLPGLNDRLTKLVKDLPAEDIRLRRLVAQRQFGFTQAQPNLQRGARVFEKSCGICHQIDGKGSKVGPPLDGAGLRGLERLLEDTLMPSRNVEVNYRSSVMSLADGRLVTGLVLREEGQTIVIADAEGKELRIPTGEVQQRRFSKLSSMPANVAEKISENDFYDLIGYLLDQREPTKQAAGQSPKRKKAGASRPAGL